MTKEMTWEKGNRRSGSGRDAIKNDAREIKAREAEKKNDGGEESMRRAT